MQLQINEKFKRLLDPLTNDEFEGLEQSILVDGCRDPLVVWNGVLVDGHNRYKICTEYDIPFNVVEMDFDDEQAALYWIIDNQLSRRNVPPNKIAYLQGKRYNEEKKEHGGDRKSEPEISSGQIVHLISDPELPKQKTAQALAEEYGVNEKTIRRNAQFATSVDTITDALGDDVGSELLGRDSKFTKDDVNKVAKIAASEPETAKQLIEKVATGEARNLAEAVKEVKTTERRADIEQQRMAIEQGTAQLPEGLFEVISLDPPWPYGTEYDPNGRRAANPYPEMSLEQIKAIELPATDDCILWLWTTHKFMRHSFELLDAWGFRDVAILTWVKDRMGLGTWLRSQSEFCIMAVKGKPTIDLTNQTTVINGALREHSRKPDEFFEMVNKLCVGRKLDYFSREAKDGWYQYGNDTTKF